MRARPWSFIQYLEGGERKTETDRHTARLSVFMDVNWPVILKG